MKKLLEFLRERLEGWLHDRYGMDELCLLILGVAAVTFLVSQLLRQTAGFAVILLLAIFLTAWAVFRCFSRNISSRNKERDAYMRVKEEICYQISLRRNTREIRKSFRYFRCKACKTKYRVPKGKGKIQITCPNCKRKTIRRT